MEPKKSRTKPQYPATPASKCSDCGDKPVEYRVDIYGRPTMFGRCASCHERAVYLEGRNSFDAR